MTLSDLAALGGFISGIGVLVTLIVLVIQVRQNNAALMRAEATATQASASAFRMEIAANRDVARLLTEGLKPDSVLDEADALRFDSLIGEIVWFAQHVWQREQIGLFPKGDWERSSTMVFDLLASARGNAWWRASKSTFPPGYLAAVDKALEARNPAR